MWKAGDITCAGLLCAAEKCNSFPGELCEWALSPQLKGKWEKPASGLLESSQWWPAVIVMLPVQGHPLSCLWFSEWFHFPRNRCLWEETHVLVAVIPPLLSYLNCEFKSRSRSHFRLTLHTDHTNFYAISICLHKWRWDALTQPTGHQGNRALLESPCARCSLPWAGDVSPPSSSSVGSALCMFLLHRSDSSYCLHTWLPKWESKLMRQPRICLESGHKIRAWILVCSLEDWWSCWELKKLHHPNCTAYDKQIPATQSQSILMCTWEYALPPIHVALSSSSHMVV